MPLDISIPTTSVSSSDKPFTIYTISIRQPIRTITLNKRYTDFVKFHDDLTQQAGAPPPAPLPGKSWFHRTVNNPSMTESRRRDLEAYLQAIEHHDDARWRHTPAWRTFLQLGTQRVVAASGNGHGSMEPGRGGGLGIKDAATWLTVHQDLKNNLHQARLALTRREQAQTAQQQHEAGAQAKKFLVLAGTLITALDGGLKTLGGGNKGSTGDVAVEKLGDGELRRRRDLVSTARKEKEGLESVLGAMAVKSLAAGGSGAGASMSSISSSGAATPGDKAHLFRGVNGSATSVSSRRTLGAPAPETARTRELDNQGVVQLQRQIMREQDEDVADLTKAVRRMREMGIQINDELQLQNEMLRMLDDDVDRVGSKIDVAKKRIAKIS